MFKLTFDYGFSSIKTDLSTIFVSSTKPFFSFNDILFVKTYAVKNLSCTLGLQSMAAAPDMKNVYRSQEKTEKKTISLYAKQMVQLLFIIISASG